jgi:hypothetical protein
MLTALAACLTFYAAPPAVSCDPTLVQDTTAAYGYRQRGELCEGLYVQPVASSALLLASFTAGVEDYDAASGRDLMVEWKSPSRGEVRVRARSTERRLYYRMDAVRPGSAGTLRWPVGLVAALKIPSAGLGLVAWTRSDVPGSESNLYLPVRLRQTHDARRSSSPYDVSLLPGRELGEVYITLAKVERDGKRGKPLRDGEPLGHGYYPAGQRIDFSVSPPGPAGVYFLHIGATLKAGGSTTLPVLFYHPGAGKN